MEGLITCARYAYSPNKLGYCGPDQNENILGYITTGTEDLGLKEILIDFQTLKPYLTFIAKANKVPDPFDSRVIEAYWIGNNLLEKISVKQFYKYLNDDFIIPKKVNKKSLKYIFGKLAMGAKPHHSFHVLNIFNRTGHLSISHTLETMDSCCINWGRVVKNMPDKLLVSYNPLILEEGKLKKGKAIQKEVTKEMHCESLHPEIVKGDLVSFHWSVVCEKITPIQAKSLDYYTQQAIDLANLSL